jgi:hypothetical protein
MESLINLDAAAQAQILNDLIDWDQHDLGIAPSWADPSHFKSPVKKGKKSKQHKVYHYCTGSTGNASKPTETKQ